MHSRTIELLNYFDAQRVVLRAAVDAVAPDLRDKSPAPGRWSVAGVVEHLSIVERRVGGMLGARIAAARAAGIAAETATDPILPTIEMTSIIERGTRIKAPSTSQPTGLDFDDAWGALEQGGESVRAAIRASDGLAVGELTAPHPVFGPLSFYQWFAFLAGHEARHASQIREDAARLK